MPKPTDGQIEAEVKELDQFVERAPGQELKQKPEYKKRIDSAFERRWNHADWWSGKHWKSCKTVEKLSSLLTYIQRERQQRPTASLEELYVRVWTLRSDILQLLPVDKKCTGFETVGTDPNVHILGSDNKRLTFDVTFGVPSLSTAKGNGQTFTRFDLQGTENMIGKPGDPAIPMWRQLVALPQGAKPVLKAAWMEKGETFAMNLVPYQEQPLDAPTTPGEGDAPKPDDKVFADQPFVINQEAYKTDRMLPASPCKITPMGQHRDVQIAQLECSTGQYNPVSDRFVLHKGMTVEVQFEGGAENFITNRTLSAFEPSATVTVDAVLNNATLRKYVKDLDLSALQCSGEELLVLTHSSFRDAADKLAEHKRDKGISTSVFNVGAGVPSRDTAEEIDDFIEDRYDDCKVRPSYVLLMGDAEFIPTFYPAGLADNAGSDFPYSNYVQILFDAFFPDFGTGRIPVDTLTQANTVVDKIVKYESDPPFKGYGNGAPFYNTASFASQFQGFRMNANGTPLNNQPGTDQRAFIETSEFARQELVDRGYTGQRIYTRTVDNGGYCIQENANGDCIQTQAPYNGNTTPRRYFNGNLLPADLGAGSGFAWDGDTADVTNAWNDGRFLILHRDHGWPGGWGDPGFTTANVNALNNGELLPVIWSVNCASGMFDNETAGGTYNTTPGGTYFAEAALRKADGGAVGVIGDTRNSPTWANNALTRGFFDAVWPDTVPSHGGNTSHKRLGDTLNWGKIYLASQVGVNQTAGGISTDQMGLEYHIWHVIGDPTLEMWTKNPYRFVLTDRVSIENVSRLSETIKYATNGTVITKLQVTPDGETRAIGRATVDNGEAKMTYLEQPSTDEGVKTIYTASRQDSVSVVLNVPATPPTTPQANRN
jgi:hypothetical protein